MGYDKLAPFDVEPRRKVVDRRDILYAGSVAFATLLVHGKDFVHLKPTGAWAAELWVFYIVSPLVVALLGPGRYAVRRSDFPLD